MMTARFDLRAWFVAAVLVTNLGVAPRLAAQCVARDICSDLETASGATVTGTPVDGRRFLFGLGFVNGKHWPQFQGDVEKAKAWNRVNMDAVLAAGATTVTIGLDWLTVETAPGVYDWSYADHQVIEAEKRGLEPFAYTGNTPNWALVSRLGDPTVPVCAAKPYNNALFAPLEDSAGKQAFKSFHRALAQRYCGRVKYYEFWNEPNGCWWMSCGCGDQSAEQKAEYARWLQRWYTAMKEGCADTILAVGGLDCNWGADPQNAAPWCAPFVETLYANGAGAAFEAVALHPYGYGDLQVALNEGKQLNWTAIDGVTQVLASHGHSSRRLWLNEWGFRTTNDTLKGQLVQSTLERLQNGYTNVFEAQYLTVTDLPNGDAWGLAASNTSTNPPTVTPRGSWYAFRDSVLGADVRRIGPRNPGLEYQGDVPTPPYTNPMPEWGPNGAWDLHTNVARPGRSVLGRRLGFYSAGLAETFGQTLDTVFKADRRYCFRSAAQGGLDDAGVVPYQIGYKDNQQNFVALRTKAIAVARSWTSQGLCYNTGSTGPELNQPVVVRFGRGADGGQSDVWFDNLLVTMKPLP